MKKSILFYAMLGFGVASCGGVTATESPPGTASDVFHLEKTTRTDLALDHVSYELAVVTTDHVTNNTFTRAETAYESCPYDYGPRFAICTNEVQYIGKPFSSVDVDFGYRPDIAAGELQTTTMVNYWDMTQWTTRSSRLV